jgi:hypothetical protein
MESQRFAGAKALCSCGHDRHHPDVDAIPSFGVWAWIMLLNGASGTPKKITYKCRRCGQVLGVTRDPRVLKTFR